MVSSVRDFNSHHRKDIIVFFIIRVKELSYATLHSSPSSLEALAFPLCPFSSYPLVISIFLIYSSAYVVEERVVYRVSDILLNLLISITRDLVIIYWEVGIFLLIGSYFLLLSKSWKKIDVGSALSKNDCDEGGIRDSSFIEVNLWFNMFIVM
jgi:hypothetical protein